MSEQSTAFTDAVEEFVSSSPWLGAEHAPAVAALRAMATTLDKGPIQAALLGQYGLVYRDLVKQKPEEGSTDPLDAALDAAGAGEG